MHRKKPQSSTALLLILMILILCAGFSGGCVGEIQTVVLAPPDNLLNPCQDPTMPKELMQTKNLKVYAKAASQGLVAYGKSFGECSGKIEALRTWRKQAAGTEK